MKLTPRLFACGLIALVLCAAGCKTTPGTADTTPPAATKPRKAPPTTLHDQNGDQAFQAFLSRLRQAVRAHDVDAVAGMMTTDFGYRVEPVGEGKGVFEYWDQNNLWPELELVVRERFVPQGEQYMVAPPESVTGGDDYRGYQAGLRLVNGSWKFAFFVNG